MDSVGWWIRDAETQSLINRASGQRVRHEAAHDGEPGGTRRLRFRYEDAEVRYPVLVTARRETYGGPGYDHGDVKRMSLAWSIDHNGSAAAWRRDGGEALPPYGLWRRVDDALFDALACWPPTEATGAQPARIDAWGGFLNGAWSPRLRRVGVGRADPGAAVEPRVRPYLEPLASPPPSWRFVARDGAAPALPGGLKPRTGYLLRHDGEAVMFPVRVESSLDKDGFYVARVRFAYADEGVSFQVNGRASPPASWGSLGAWSFELNDLIDAETRGGPAGDDLLCSRRVYDWRGPYVQPLPRLAQRLTAALIDGWLAWDGSGRLLDDPEQLASLASQGAPPPLPALAASGVDLGAKGLVAVDGGYHGGRFARRSMTGYLHQDGWTEAGAPLALGNG